jgi:hypothetical protein
LLFTWYTEHDDYDAVTVEDSGGGIHNVRHDSAEVQPSARSVL